MTFTKYLPVPAKFLLGVCATLATGSLVMFCWQIVLLDRDEHASVTLMILGAGCFVAISGYVVTILRMFRTWWQEDTQYGRAAFASCGCRDCVAARRGD
jgi:hypothetical protein